MVLSIHEPFKGGRDLVTMRKTRERRDIGDNFRSLLKGVTRSAPHPSCSLTLIPTSPSYLLFSDPLTPLCSTSAAHSHLRLLLLLLWKLLSQTATWLVFSLYLRLNSKVTPLTTGLPGNPAPPAPFLCLP